ncbi:MAG: hypothetical protein DRJ42_04850 [Deltaproteobacteria bacterium]|nr:MAG: hypothetical protein DRJ42_04850 [Deltaproteobacteria bacterium]
MKTPHLSTHPSQLPLILVPALPLILMACGGATPAAAPTPVEPAATSAGGEAPAEPLVLRTTTPIPVPQPAIAREDLVEPLQGIWTETEEIVAQRPPEPPTATDQASIENWAAESFAPWVDARRGQIQQMEPALATLQQDPLSLAVSAALFGYAYEDTAAGIRGAPVPATIATDAELLEIYVATLDEALHPFAQRALESYAYCATTIARLAQEPNSPGPSAGPEGDEQNAQNTVGGPWISWAAYCLDRGRDVADVFELGADSETAAEEPAAVE